VSDNRFAFSQARATTRADLTNSWLSGGTLNLYSGTRPASAATAITDQTLLVSFDFDSPAGVVANGVLTIELATEIILASGSAVWARAFDSDGVVIADGDVTPTGSGGLVMLNNTALTEGGYLSSLSFTLTEF